MAEGQRRIAGLHGGDVHRLEAGVVQPFGVVVMVSEDQDSLARDSSGRRALVLRHD